MSPEQIEAVRRTWSGALAEGDALVSSIAADLDGAEEARADRARWAVESITRLLLVLDRPGAYRAPAPRSPIALPEVDRVQAAVLHALSTPTELDAPAAHAWRLALALFRELVAAPHLDPFGTGPRTTSTAPTTPTTTTPPARPADQEKLR